MSLRQSTAEQTIEFEIEPGAVAKAVQDVIPELKLKIKDVSRETGVISAAAGAWSLEANRWLTVRIAKAGTGTKVNVTAAAGEGLMTDGRAQRLLTEFIQKLSAHKDIAGKVNAGW